ncbi:WXG100 family type VII secretion target [Leucobacter sp. CSA2]|uniref:WXG100 family type VII secretion target n=1 Tax=Leucobacter edaphi TaxID=2796472 RepID=A0A934QF11_9MICO|nr:WXG100 family type VII secretion target [Leucobacter edaphi]MBK0422062.1 WXG100 family type VII secretion target [Leucobacter edaphi]
MTSIRVSYGEIEAAASQLAAGREEITQKINSLQAQIQSLVGSGFVTEHASGKFQEAFTKYAANASGLIAHLGEIQQFLVGAAQAMRELDAQIASRIG